MSRRKVPLVNGEIYHIVSKSIAGFKVFNTADDCERICESLFFHSMENTPCTFSTFKKFKENPESKLFAIQFDGLKKLVAIMAYCIMPTHIHLLLKQVKEDGISKFMSLLLQSYSQYFNLKHKRKGPLWQKRFENVLIKNDDQYIHVTRYIHLNPVTAHLVEAPEGWKYSSYKEYVGLCKEDKKLCNFSGYLDMDVDSYAKFVKDQIGYQRELALIKHLIIE